MVGKVESQPPRLSAHRACRDHEIDTRSTQKKQQKEEQFLYDWLLAQRIRYEVGALEPWQVAKLNDAAPGWDEPVDDGELCHALAVDHEELNAAFEIWWNQMMDGEPLTFAEIRVKAAMEM